MDTPEDFILDYLNTQSRRLIKAEHERHTVRINGSSFGIAVEKQAALI